MIQRLRSLSVKASLTLVLAIFSIFLLLIAWLGFSASSTGDKALKELHKINVQQLNAINLARAHLSDVQLNFERFVDATNQGKSEQASAYFTESQAAMQRAETRFAQFWEAPKTERGKPYADAIGAAYEQLVNYALVPQQQALKSNDIEAFRALQDESVASASEFKRVSQEFIDYADARGEALIADFDIQTQRFEIIEIIVLLLTAAVVVLVRWGMVRAVIRPLDEAVQHFEHIAQGDLSKRIADHGNNEIGKLFAAMQRMQAGLTRTVATVRDSSGSIHVGTREIASGNSDLSSRTEQQAASLEETAASMEQLTATVRQNADNARQGSSLASDASVTAGRGGEVVQEVIVTMHGIADSSKKVVDIISVIDSIAFQTNILALNASVEAARAGEQGRGFAVVAGEVRNLASRSADAAKEIKALIEASAAQVEKGSSLVESAGATMRDIVASVRRVTDIMDEISAASQEQSSGIEQVNLAISQMDQVTQQNAALVQQASAATASLEEQAEQLEAAVAQFRLDNNISSGQAALPHVRQQARTARRKSQSLAATPSEKPLPMPNKQA